MKKFTRITAFVLMIMMLFSSMASAVTPSALTISTLDSEKLTAPAAEPAKKNAASIVSPSNNSISTSDSLLVSVKLTQPGTIKVTVFEECIEKIDIRTTVSAVSVSGSAVTKSALTTYTAVSLQSVDTSSFEAIDFTSNPALLTYVDREYEEPVLYTSKENIGFYTKQLSVKPGLYRILVETLDEEGKTAESVSSLIAVKEKPAEAEAPVFEQKQSGALKLLQNLLKSIFK